MAAQPVTSDATLDDVELARRIGEGDHLAFETVMRRHNGMLFRVARSILKDDHEAEDALQDAYIDAHRQIRKFRGDSKLSTWLTRIVINEALGRLRKRKGDRVVVPLATASHDSPEHEVSNLGDPTSETPEHAVLRTELRRLLEEKIDRLPVAYRTVFIMREVEEMTVEETAACLAIPDATVRSRLFRARALLRESLARELDMATVDVFAFAGERCDRIVAGVLTRVREFRLEPDAFS